MLLYFCYFLLQVYLGCMQASGAFITSPQSVNAIHGEIVIFNCTVLMADLIVYRINETLAQQIEGFEEGLIVGNAGSTLSLSLTVTASVQYNNSNITCIGITFGQSSEYSEPAVLLIQGLLSSVSNLHYSIINSSTVTISWNPPFTLPGTDITGYNISATNNGKTTSYFTSNIYHVLLLTDITDSPCNEIIVTVSGYNGLDGVSTTLSQGIYLLKVPTGHQATIPANIHHDRNGVITSTSINVSSICYGQYPTHINLTIQLYGNGSVVTAVDNIPLVMSTNNTDILTTTNDTTILLPVDNNYTAIITFSNIDGQFNFIAFNTNVIHGVQDVAVTDNISPTIEFVCMFTHTVSVMGCRIELILLKKDSIRFIGVGNRTDDDEAVVSIEMILPGSYSVRVYDITSNDDVSSVIAYKINELIILPQTTSTSTYVITTTSYSVTDVINVPVTTTTSYSVTKLISNYVSTSEQLIMLSSPISTFVTISPSISSNTEFTRPTSNAITVAIATVACIVVMIQLVIISCMLILLHKKYTRNKTASNTINNGTTNSVFDAVPVVPNPSYQDPRDIIGQSNIKNRTIVTDTNPSYSHVEYYHYTDV